jgi:CheY-like chemotaxis protein
MKKHIFLVDDDEDDVAGFLAALNEVDGSCKCTWAKSGDLAIKQLLYLTPDIVFLDINMPGMNGLECLAEIKQLPHLQTVPVVLHSSGLTASYKKRGMELGASAYLEKPDTGPALGELLSRFISGEAAAEAAAWHGSPLRRL